MTPEMLLEQLFQKNILPRAVPINVETICSHYNISIEHKIYPDDTVGQIEFPPDNGAARIFIHPFENSHSNRRRFTIAHELGHFSKGLIKIRAAPLSGGHSICPTVSSG